MAISFDSCEIPAGESGQSGGAVFNLVDSAGMDATFETTADERVNVSESSRAVVVSNLGASDYETAWRKGLTVAQQALDVFSARGLVDLHLQDPQYDHLAVYGQDGGQVLRVVGVATLNVHFGAAGVVVRSKEGEIVPQPPPVSAWHESMRYYRQAQLSDDLFESFRSLWLGVENLLDSLEPATPGEREKKWLKRALKKADAAINLKRFLPQRLKGNAVDAAYKYFYDETRAHLFHAKASRRPLLPYEEIGTNLLVSRHGRLTRVYLALLEHVTGVRRPTSMLMKGGFELMAAGVEKGPTAILVTDDPVPEDPDENRINPQGGQVIEMAAAREKQLERPFLRVFLGRLDGADVEAIEHLRKTAFRSDGDLVSGHAIDGDLAISDLTALEVQMGLRIRSGGLPKSFAEM
jgi:hypothetical protein